jgi:hypothetical protein
MSVIVHGSGLPQEAPPLWGKLSPGPYAVGFRSLWELDHGRTYNTMFDDGTSYALGKAPRPILINTWYPAQEAGAGDGRPMRHRDYLAIQTDDPRLAKFATKLREYEEAVICRYILGRPVAELTDQERGILDQYLDTPTACLRDAPPADATFPLVLYHCGAGASIEDNAVLCEFLANHGYVVMTSVFQWADGKSFGIDALHASEPDMTFLIAHARRLGYVDWDRIGAAGHSAGAQALLISRSRVGSPIDAVVSLDSTQDYFSLDTHAWEYMQSVVKNARNLSVPLLIVANAHAFFHLADQLKHAERYYLTVDQLDHEDFVAQGVARRLLACHADPKKSELRTALDAARAGYEAICEAVLAFFDVHLKRRRSNENDLVQKYGSNQLGGPAPHVDHVPAGATGPGPFRDEVGLAPTPRQFRPLLAARGIESTIALWKDCHEKDPSSPIFHQDFAYALVDELVEQARIGDAAKFARLAELFGHNIAQMYVGEGDSQRQLDSVSEAAEHYRKALLIDPSNARAAAGMSALRDLGPSGSAGEGSGDLETAV